MTINDRRRFLAERHRSVMLAYVLGCAIDALETELNDVGHDGLVLLLAGMKAELKSIDATHAKALKEIR